MLFREDSDKRSQTSFLIRFTCFVGGGVITEPEKGEIMNSSSNWQGGSCMKRTFQALVIVAMTAILGSCGSKTSSDLDNLKNPTGMDAKVVLKIFAGYSCSSCNEELPLLNSRIVNELGSQAALLDARVYVVAGPNWTKATQEVADRYGRELGLTQFKMLTDNRCQSEYRKYYEGSSCLVPATVLTNPNEEVIEIYDPGLLNMDEFMSRVKELINAK